MLSQEDIEPEDGEGPPPVADWGTKTIRVCADLCGTCIYRPGNRMQLEKGALAEIHRQAVSGKGQIVCHKTLTWKVGAVCRGYLNTPDGAKASEAAAAIRSGDFAAAQVDPDESEPPLKPVIKVGEKGQIIVFSPPGGPKLLQLAADDVTLLRHLANGKGCKGAALAMNVQPTTTKTRQNRLAQRMRVKNVGSALVMTALQWGILTVDDIEEPKPQELPRRLVELRQGQGEPNDMCSDIKPHGPHDWKDEKGTIHKCGGRS